MTEKSLRRAFNLWLQKEGARGVLSQEDSWLAFQTGHAFAKVEEAEGFAEALRHLTRSHDLATLRSRCR